MPYINPNDAVTITFIRYTPGTRSDATTIAQNVSMCIVPMSGGSSRDGMHIRDEVKYNAVPATGVNSIIPGDVVLGYGNNNLYVERVDPPASVTIPAGVGPSGVQRFILSNWEEGVR